MSSIFDAADDLDSIPGLEPTTQTTKPASTARSGGAFADLEDDDFPDLGADQPVSDGRQEHTSTGDHYVEDDADDVFGQHRHSTQVDTRTADTAQPGRRAPQRSQHAAPASQRLPFAERAQPLPDPDDIDGFGAEPEMGEEVDAYDDGSAPRVPVWNRLIMPMGVGILALVAATVGYLYVLPMFTGGSNQTVVVNTLPPRQTRPLATTTPQPTMGGQIAAAVPTPAPVQQPADAATIPGTPTPVTTVPAAAAEAVEPPQVTRAVEKPSSMIAADMKAMTDRMAALEGKIAEVDQMRAANDNLRNSLQSALAQQAESEKRLDAMAKEVDSLKGALSSAQHAATRAQAAAASAAKAAAAPSAPVAVADEAAPPLKPVVLDGYVLKGVAQNSAWLDSGHGIVKVSVGDALPSAGVVKAIRQTTNGWIVVTSMGIIRP